MRRWNKWIHPVIAVACACTFATTAAAQWLEVPVPGTPRTPDGKANLSAPTPRTADGKPDHSGIWKPITNRYNRILPPEGVNAPLLPWAAELYKQRLATQGFDVPMTWCLPHGVPDAMTVPAYPWKIVQTPNLMLHLYEEFTKYRQIHTDGRQLPVDPNPTWYGYSIGRWEGETFVVNTAGFKEGSWLDIWGHPHTDAMKVTERFRRLNFGRLEVDVNIDDPKAYSRPWDADTMKMDLQPDTELLEHLCESNRDLAPVLDYWQKQGAKPTIPVGK